MASIFTAKLHVVFQLDQIHSVPKFEIYVEESLNFTVRCLLWSVPVEHELYSLYKQSVKQYRPI